MDKHVIHAFDFSLQYAQGLASDIPDERLAQQFDGFVNHAAWQLGHMAYALGGVLQYAGVDVEKDEKAVALFGMGSSPVGERDVYPSKQSLLDLLVTMHERVEPALDAFTSERMAMENPVEGFRQSMPTVGDAVTFLLTTHYAVHLGQLAAWKRAAGIGKPMR